MLLLAARLIEKKCHEYYMAYNMGGDQKNCQ